MFGRTKKEISIHEKYGENLWAVEADKSQIEQVLLNLFVNAWQAMPGGGNLYIDTKNYTPSKYFLELYNPKPEKFVKISVTDTGVGIGKEIQDRIFDPFFSTKEIGGGTGLGLASAYGIVKNHEGFIDVYSEKNKGSTFNVYLPVTEKTVRESNIKLKKILTGTETILIVDDEELIIKVVKPLLEKMGYRALTAAGGKEAIDIYNKNWEEIAIVIVDLIMPDMDGEETFNKLKEINPEIKAILSSGYSMSGHVLKVIENGCKGFLQKPFDMEELTNKIREILES